MSPAPAKDQTKSIQPMSISQLCQQDSDDEMHHSHDSNTQQDLNQDPLDLDAENQANNNYTNGNNHNSQNGHNNSNNNNCPSSDEFEEFDDSSRSRGPTVQPDPAEQLAAEALGDMANPARASSFATSNAPFISRMSSLPLVNSAIKAYESGKQNSKVMKYGAEMVESSVKTLSRPVFDKLEPKLGQLDDFACRQLDKLEKVYPAKSDAQVLPSPTNSARSSNDILRFDNAPNGNNGAYIAYRSRNDSIDSTSSTTSSRPSFDVLRSRSTRHEESTLRQRSSSQSSQRSFQYGTNGYYPQQEQQPQQQQQQVGSLSTAPSQQFSGWRGVVATVGTASAAGVAIFSEESMKSLKYCLQWLQYAVQHIDHQIGLLRSFLVSLANPSRDTALVPSNAASTLASIKKEVVETLRKVITVVSRYAGACLPDQAKISVRQFILSMPVRWATLNNESIPSTPMGSPSLGPQSDRNAEQAAALNETSERATKVLVLAHESSDMLQSVASIFKDSVDKAENWMDKLRYVGMNPQNNSEGLPSWAPTGFPGAPGPMPGGFPGAGSGTGTGSGTGLEQYSLRQTQNSSSATNVNGHAHTNGASNGSTNGNGHAYPSTNMGSPSRSLKSSPRMNGRENFNANLHRHAYRQKNSMSGDEDSGTEEDDAMPPVAMDDSEDEAAHDHFSNGSNGSHGPLKRSMGSASHTQGNAVRRRKKRGESAEVVAGLGANGNSTNGDAPHAIKQEPM